MKTRPHFLRIDARNAQIMALVAEGLTTNAIMARMKLSRSTVNAVKRDHAGAAVEILAWVPLYLHADYRAIAGEDGEEAAASYARNRKRAQVSSGSMNCGAR